MRVDLTFPDAPAGQAPRLVELAAESTTVDPSSSSTPPRFLVGLAVPFGVPSTPASTDRRRYQFSGPPRNADQLVDVVDQHDAGTVIGRLAEPWSETSDGLDARARLFNTTAARDVVELAAEGVRTGFSVQALFETFTEDEQGVRHVDEWEAGHLAVVRNPAFTQTRGFTLAASAAPTTGENMPPTAETATPPAADREVVDLGAANPVTVTELAERVAEVLKQGEHEGRHPLARFKSREHYLSEFMAAVLAKDEDKAAQLSAEFAAVDQVVANNPGLMPPNWRTAVIANLDARRPLITAAGGPIGIGDSGMDSNWPYFDGNLDAMIAEQAAEGGELNSVRVDIKKGTASIKTAGVYSKLTYQLLMRSTPAYLASYLAINEAAWARWCEAKFTAAVQAAAVESSGALAAAGAITADVFRGQLFDASMDVEDATGQPATYVAASSDVFAELGKLGTLHNPKYGTQNAPGTASAATLTIDVNGLEVRRGKFLTAGTVIVSNDKAAKFAESGPMTATDEQAANLGRNVATWGMYVPAEVYFPAGIVRLDRAA